MPVAVAPTIPSPTAAPLALWTSYPAVAAPPEPVPPGPETPVAAAAPRVQLMALDATGQPLGEIRSALVESWSDPLDHDGAQIRVQVSGHDPLLWSLGVDQGIVCGRRVRQIDAKALRFLVVVDGQPSAPGFLLSDVPLGDDTVRLDLRGGMDLLRGLTLRGGDDDTGSGFSPSIEDLVRAEDALEGRGSFDGPTGISGWTPVGPAVAASMTVFLSAPRSLRITGTGRVNGPWVTIPGSEHHRAGWFVECAVRLPSAGVDDDLRVGVAVEVQRRVGSSWVTVTPVPGDPRWWSDDADPEQTEWQMLQARGNTAMTTQPHRMRQVIVIWGNSTGQPVHVDEVRYRQNSRIGSALPQDLSGLAARVLGGSVFRRPDHGLGYRINGLTGTELSMLWYTSDRVSALDALSTITSRPDGPDVWFRSDWRYIIEPRRGQTRRDVQLDPQSVLEVAWTVGPGVDDHLTLTDPTIQHRTPWAPGRLRTEATVRPPIAEWHVQAGWAEGWAEQAALRQVVADVTVPWSLGWRLQTGDCVWLAYEVGGEGFVGWVRVFDRKLDPQALTVVLSVGVDAVSEAT